MHCIAVIWVEKWTKSKNYLRLNFLCKMWWKNKRKSLKSKMRSIFSKTMMIFILLTSASNKSLTRIRWHQTIRHMTWTVRGTSCQTGHSIWTWQKTETWLSKRSPFPFTILTALKTHAAWIQCRTSHQSMTTHSEAHN